MSAILSVSFMWVRHWKLTLGRHYRQIQNKNSEVLSPVAFWKLISWSLVLSRRQNVDDKRKKKKKTQTTRETEAPMNSGIGSKWSWIFRVWASLCLRISPRQKYYLCPHLNIAIASKQNFERKMHGLKVHSN